MPESANRDAYSCMGVARVQEIRPDGGLVLDPDYIAPCLRIDSSQVLTAFLNELSGKLESGAQELTGWSPAAAPRASPRCATCCCCSSSTAPSR